MGLKHLVFPEALVKTPGGDITVRGLTTEHIVHIVRQHGPKLQPVFDTVMEKIKTTQDFHPDEVGRMLVPFIDAAPQAVAQVIACGAGEPDEVDIAASLPLPVQIDAIEKILALTFDAVGGPKKFMETVIRIAQGANGLLSHLSKNQPSLNG